MTIEEMERLYVEATRLSPLPWTIVEDSAGGKDEAWCHWHTVGPLSLTGKEANDDDRLVVAAVNALPALLAVVKAAKDIIDHKDLYWEKPKTERDKREETLRAALLPFAGRQG